MSTSTMMSNQHRRFPTPGFVDPTFKKRKERESDGFETLKPAKPISSRPGSIIPVCPKNQLLAGYLAHEFLSKGTLFGQEYDPARSGAASNSSRVKMAAGKAEPEVERNENKNKRYAEVADLLKTDEAHLPGIVNPAQLARFLQL
ncbi:uncharacterized protein LOC124912262 [Impatiens glandulifera]|uniref:uncharacterized protein LOC124912262 n=1 Tax=Impatiens glandulifera TaxID=253017 RepID=UPI001FB07E80|nr:uncharacterized protein LOC124912262 [Impatiens glandulifera]